MCSGARCEYLRWRQDTNAGAVGVFYESATTVSVGIGFTGDLTAKTHTNLDTDATGAIHVTQGTSNWAAWPASTGSAAVGSYTLSISSTYGEAGTASARVYGGFVGQLDATLPAIGGTGTTGTVTVKVVLD